MWDDERDARLRREAMAWLAIRSNDGADPVPSADLREFSFDGERMPLLDAQRGIRKPAVLDAALSIRTVCTPEGRQRPYEDAPGPDGMLRYKWRGSDPDHPENRALRRALQRGVPLVWFFGVGPALHLSARSASWGRSAPPSSSLQEHHGERLRVVPAARTERPDRELLALRYERFRAAG